MKHYISGLCLGLSLITSSLIADETLQISGMQEQQLPVAEQIGTFRSQMQKQVLLAQRRVTELGKATTGLQNSTEAVSMDALQTAMKALDVKTTVVSTYYYSPVLASPVLRSAIMEVLVRDKVDDSDLTKLQKIADAEQSKISK